MMTRLLEKRRLVPAVVLALVMSFAPATIAQAALLTLTLQTFGPATSMPNAWELTAQTSVGDNDGIAGYNIPVLNAATADHNVIGQGAAGILVNGFTLNDDTGNVLFGGMNSTIPASLIYGVGNSGFLVPAPPAGLTNVGMAAIGDPFGPVLIATGTGDWLSVAIGAANANVWTLGESSVGGTRAEAAGVEIVVNRMNVPADVPEPATLLLLAAGLGLVSYRKRHET